MCLVTKHLLPKISFRKIKVYKIVILKNGELITPFQHVKLLERAQERFYFPEKCKGYFRINEGMIHAFRNKRAASIGKVELYFMSNLLKDNIRIISGYIPPFTRYYIGKHGDICAKRMKYEISD